MTCLVIGAVATPFGQTLARMHNKALVEMTGRVVEINNHLLRKKEHQKQLERLNKKHQKRGL